MLSNYKLLDEFGFAVIIESHGLEWNMHDSSRFLAFDYSIQEQTAKLSWKYLDSEKISNQIDIIFYNVYYFEVSPRDPEMSKGEDMNFDTVSYMDPDDELSIYRFSDIIPSIVLRQTAMPEKYHIVFRFRGGQMIRIGAETSEFNLK